MAGTRAFVLTLAILVLAGSTGSMWRAVLGGSLVAIYVIVTDLRRDDG